ncbi:hypothetical protein L345_13891, partial [Ophiophagus hannah]
MHSMRKLDRFLGNGLATDLEYNHWHKQRRIMDPAFSRNYLIGLMEIFNDQAEDLMKVLNEKADGEVEVDMMSLLRRLTLDIIAKANEFLFPSKIRKILTKNMLVAFGLELNTLHCDQTPFPHAFTMVMKGLSKERNPFFQ